MTEYTKDKDAKSKRSYQYKFYGCEHKTVRRQAVRTVDTHGFECLWVGTICTICNTIRPNREVANVNAS